MLCDFRCIQWWQIANQGVKFDVYDCLRESVHLYLVLTALFKKIRYNI